MDKQNSTCIQSVTLTFNLYPKTGQFSRGLLLSGAGEEAQILQNLKGLGDYLSNRLDRISEMTDILIKVNSDWKIAAKKDKVILQTSSVDFAEIQNLLKAKGFDSDEYCLNVDYSRKWGVL